VRRLSVVMFVDGEVSRVIGGVVSSGGIRIHLDEDQGARTLPIGFLASVP